MFHVEHYHADMAKTAPPSTPKSSPTGRSRLGRGLSSLMQVNANPANPAAAPPAATAGGGPSQAEAATSNSPLRDLSVDQIAANPHQPRKKIDPAALAELAASIRTNGVIQPLIVIDRRDGTYELVAGERRLRAAKQAGLAHVPAVVRDVEAHEQAQMALVENIQREDLNSIDRAEAYRSLQKLLGLTQTELAERVGEDRSKIANHVRLLELADAVKELVRSGDLPLGHAKVLAGVEDAAEQVRLANLCVKQNLSVRNLERLVASDPQPPAATPKGGDEGRAVYLKQLADNVSRALGMPCDLNPTGKSGGKLTVHFKSLDQFDRLMEHLGVEIE